MQIQPIIKVCLLLLIAILSGCNNSNDTDANELLNDFPEARPSESANTIQDASKPSPEAMIYLEYRYISERIPEASHDAKLRKLWRAGDSHARVEKKPDTAKNQHMVIMSNSPYAWVWNRADNTAKKYRDAGPSYKVIIPAFAHSPSPVIRSLQLGKEIEFFITHGAHPGLDTVVEGIEATTLELEHDGYLLTLAMDKEQGYPQLLTLSKPGISYQILYERYETGLPFVDNLFSIPDNVTVSSGTPLQAQP